MKPAVMLTLMLAAALTLFADEAKKSEEPAAAAAPAATTTAEQSPLVAAAKRANRLGKKPVSKVITNDTLKTSGGNAHVTTSDKVVPIPKAPTEPLRPTPEMIADREKAARRKIEEAVAAEKKKAEEKRTSRLAAYAEAAEEEYPDDVDPAEAEKALQDAQQEKPPRM
ncbi:MAG TPA: hypothetical protein VNA69_02380 [Thermoanaerobaculia bacterium]|nr:hypothetical protein [Thermoanaerobaculia bacterium]